MIRGDVADIEELQLSSLQGVDGLGSDRNVRSLAKKSLVN